MVISISFVEIPNLLGIFLYNSLINSFLVSFDLPSKILNSNYLCLRLSKQPQTEFYVIINLMQKLDFNEQFKKAFHLMENTTNSLFITGKAGTGKSTLLTYFVHNTNKIAVVLAPTGVAALNVRGETVHSFFRFKPGITVEKARKKGARVKPGSIYHKIDAIIIDEISMVRADLLDCVDVFLKSALENSKPFGGLQMIFIGDLYQLPPVLSNQEKEHFELLYDSPYFFSSQIMAGSRFNLIFIELEKIYRQSEEHFITLLNAIRNNTITNEQISILNQNVNPNCQQEDTGYIYLTTTNKAATELNNQKLQRLETKLHIFEAEVDGDFDPKIAPTDFELQVKIGAQVMFLTNHQAGYWVNGTIGEIVDILDDEIAIQTKDGDIVGVQQNKWIMYKYYLDSRTNTLGQEKIGSFTQYPIKLAWAVTIHKSQGKTFNKVIVDLGWGTFAHGQLYVALSRCSSFSGLVFKKPLRKGHVIMDNKVIEFLTQFQVEEKLKLI